MRTPCTLAITLLFRCDVCGESETIDEVWLPKGTEPVFLMPDGWREGFGLTLCPRCAPKVVASVDEIRRQGADIVAEAEGR